MIREEVNLLSANQYKYQFKKWKWKRNISSKMKAALAGQIQSRAEAGKRFGHISYQGKSVEMKKIRRHLKEAMRQEPQDMVLQGGSTPAINYDSIVVGSMLPFAKTM